MLRSWLMDASADERNAPCHAKDENRVGQILFQSGMGDPLPAGNCYILRALSMGLLNRQAPDYESWLTILEEHVQRQEEPRMWQALAYSELTYLGNAERSRAAALLAAIFERFPELLDVRQGLHLLNQHMGWLPDALTRSWLETLRDRGTVWHAQAFGELMVLRAYRRPDDSWARAEIERLVEASNTTDDSIIASRHGIAFMCALAVREEVLLAVADLWLVRLAETEQTAISAALLEAFPYGDPLPYSARIDALLTVFETHPFHLRHDGIGGLLHTMQAYVRPAPNRVIRLANAIIDMLGNDLADIRLRAAAHASDLVDLALTLQDIPDQLLAGLDLFERLQDLNLGEVEAVLNEREAQPGVQPAPRRRPRRAPQRRAR